MAKKQAKRPPLRNVRAPNTRLERVEKMVDVLSDRVYRLEHPHPDADPEPDAEPAAVSADD